ncbi:MAG TPA: sugar ABC transporter permease [Candidatus Eisenbergiella pullistercoris]|uniref:Sugar ABC transporter permease n=1 Tax=Candidatus Eisenbergiella pullistercoris TaxID=2838555 RepID=A0A9D1YNZ8_9FIRM|nr:sugar ABC transporter permease [Candidatus Eisenbergiella pullistercoris]
MKKNKAMIIGFVTPCALTLLIMYLYPVARTIFMSFFAIESVTADVGSWSFYGLGNYGRIFGSATFMTSLSNMLKIWLVGGILVLTIALLFAVILTSGIRFKKFFRAAIYLPNVISAVALATMWIQYVYNQDYGLLNNMLEMVGLEGVKWLGTDMKFWAMLFAFVFGAVGYYMLIFISGIERIPQDLYEAATIDGANKIQQFFRITLPLLKGIIKTNLTFWSINTITFFLWSKMFSPITSEASTIVPVVYLYDTVFGSTGNTERDAGAGAAVGVVLALFVGAVYLITSKLLKDDDLELPA